MATPTRTAAAQKKARKSDGNGFGETAPIISTPADQNSHPGWLLSFTINAYDPDGQTVTFALINNPPAGATIDMNSGQFSWTPTAAQLGTSTITVQATDSAGYSSTAQFQVFVINRPPTIPQAGPFTVPAGQQFNFNVNATDPENDLPLSYTVLNGGPGTIDNTGKYTNNAVQLGTVNVTIQVSDCLGGASQMSFSLTGQQMPVKNGRGQQRGNSASGDAKSKRGHSPEGDGQADAGS